MLMGFKHRVLEKTKPKIQKKKVEEEMKKEIKILVGVTASAIILTAIGTWLITKPQTTQTVRLAVPTTNALPIVAVPTNAPATASQVDLLAAEVKALKAANEEREARVQRLLKLNEETQRERATSIPVITVPLTVIVTNPPPMWNINGTLNIGGSSSPQTPSKESKKGGGALMEKSQKSKTLVPMYTITNSTSTVSVTGTNTVSVTNTSVQNFLRPGKRSLLGVILGGRANPISTDTPSGNSVQQGHPPTPVIIVEQPYGYGYPYGYGGYRSPYQPVYSGYGSSERRLFGVHFHTR
ncbi:MAG: hypothetical protein Q8R17_02640 [bacterium]|nr:hypothetical protein [bacterium]